MGFRLDKSLRQLSKREPGNTFYFYTGKYKIN